MGNLPCLQEIQIRIEVGSSNRGLGYTGLKSLKIVEYGAGITVFEEESWLQV